MQIFRLHHCAAQMKHACIVRLVQRRTVIPKVVGSSCVSAGNVLYVLTRVVASYLLVEGKGPMLVILPKAATVRIAGR